MPIVLKKYGVSAGVGAARIASRYVDEVQGWVEPFKRSKDYVGVAGFILGLVDAAAEFSKDGWVGETLALSSLPLVMDSFYEAIRHYAGGSPGGGKQGTQGKQGRWRLVQQGTPMVSAGPVAQISSY